MSKSPTIKSAGKILDVLTALEGHFVHGLTLGEIAKATCNSLTDTRRYVQALENSGFAEVIHETGRYRISVEFARKMVLILRQCEEAGINVQQ